jgi:hypothetical protein
MDAETLPGCDPTAARERFTLLLLPPGIRHPAAGKRQVRGAPKVEP